MTKSNIKILVLAVWGLLGSHTVQAQELNVGVSGGLAGMKFQDSKLTKGNEINFSVGYAFKIHENWGFEIGGEVGRYSIQINNTKLSDAYQAIDTENHNFEFRYNYQDHSEKISGYHYGIPFKVFYESAEINDRNTRIYASAGFKYTMYAKADSDLTITDLTTSGYYPQWDAELHGPDGTGFGSLGNFSESQTLKIKDSFSLLGEVGVKQYLANGNAVYIGFYGNIDLAGADQEKARTIDYNKSYGNQPLQINSVLGNEKDGDSYKLRMFNVGLRIKYAFSL